MHTAITLCLLAAVAASAFWLKRMQTELQIIAGHAPSAIAHVVEHGGKLKYRFVNQKYAALYGRQPVDVIGKQPEHILGPEIFARSHANMRRAISGETVKFDLELGDKTVEVIYYPDMPPPARSNGFVGVITDVSDLRALQRQAGSNPK